MKVKNFSPFIALTMVLAMGVYFLVTPSYQRSIEAKYHYEMGDYEKAYALAQEAFSMDLYNRMASTIMAQSKTSLKYVAYIKQAKSYMKEINTMATQERITGADRIRIKMMSEIMVDSYVKLAPSVITDTKLVAKAAQYHNDFGKLLEKVAPQK